MHPAVERFVPAIEVPFPLEDLLRRYGPRRPAMQPLYERMLGEAERLVEAKGLRRAFPSKCLPQFAARLPGAETISLGLVTLGPQLEVRVSALFAADPAAAVVLDEIGTAWVGAIARQMHRAIREEARAQGRRAGPSYRPGIGRWPIEWQRELFRHLPAERIGVRLTASLTMVPQKSASMIVGVGAWLGRTAMEAGQAQQGDPSKQRGMES